MNLLFWVLFWVSLLFWVLFWVSLFFWVLFWALSGHQTLYVLIVRCFFLNQQFMYVFWFASPHIIGVKKRSKKQPHIIGVYFGMSIACGDWWRQPQSNCWNAKLFSLQFLYKWSLRCVKWVGKCIFFNSTHFRCFHPSLYPPQDIRPISKKVQVFQQRLSPAQFQQLSPFLFSDVFFI